MEKLSFKLEVFEGPLDALLFLISKNKLNIYDIPISELLSQYMGYLNAMQEMDLEITSDFLEMASRLVQIKTAMLLPRHEESDEPDPRDELMNTLIEYGTCKRMAAALRERAAGFDLFTRAPVKFGRDAVYHLSHDADELRKAIFSTAVKIKRRMPPPASAFTGVVGRQIVSVASRIIHILRCLVSEGVHPMESLFDSSRSRSEAVATFLALLELIKSKRVALEDVESTPYVKIINRNGG
ncbi:MAG: segregation/condensation protein A [Clostridia bacterium]|nr:segregation/condensation protein A [Clostridia bacterium]